MGSQEDVSSDYPEFPPFEEHAPLSHAITDRLSEAGSSSPTLSTDATQYGKQEREGGPVSSIALSGGKSGPSLPSSPAPSSVARTAAHSNGSDCRDANFASQSQRKVGSPISSNSKTNMFGLSLHSQFSLYFPLVGKCKTRQLREAPALKPSSDGYMDDRYLREATDIIPLVPGLHTAVICDGCFIDVWDASFTRLLRSIEAPVSCAAWLRASGQLAIASPREGMVFSGDGSDIKTVIRFINPVTEQFEGFFRGGAHQLEVDGEVKWLCGAVSKIVRKGVQAETDLLVVGGGHEEQTIHFYSIPDGKCKFMVKAQGPITAARMLDNCHLLAVCWFHEAQKDIAQTNIKAGEAETDGTAEANTETEGVERSMERPMRRSFSEEFPAGGNGASLLEVAGSSYKSGDRSCSDLPSSSVSGGNSSNSARGSRSHESPTPSTVALAPCGEAGITMISPRDGDIAYTLCGGHTAPISDVISLPDGRIVSGDESGEVLIWGAGACAAGEYLLRLRGHKSPIVGLGAMKVRECDIRREDPREGKCEEDLELRTMVPSGQVLVSCGAVDSDGLLFWDIDSAVCLQVTGGWTSIHRNLSNNIRPSVYQSFHILTTRALHHLCGNDHELLYPNYLTY